MRDSFDKGIHYNSICITNILCIKIPNTSLGILECKTYSIQGKFNKKYIRKYLILDLKYDFLCIGVYQLYNT